MDNNSEFNKSNNDTQDENQKKKSISPSSQNIIDSEKQTRKRKWDVSQESEIGEYSAEFQLENKVPRPSIPTSSIDAAQQAAETAKKLSDSLKLKQQLNHSSVRVTSKKFEQEIDINHLPSDIRSQVCKSTTLTEIRNSTGVIIKVRGKYKNPLEISSELGKEANPLTERPLHLYFTADTQESLNAAVKKISDLIQEKQNHKKPEVYRSLYYNAKTVVGMEGSDPQFNVLERILGPQGSYLDHIAKTANVVISLRGKDVSAAPADAQHFVEESDEPMHIWIQGESKQVITNAKSLTENLVAHVKKEYLIFSRSKFSTSTSPSISSPPLSLGGVPLQNPYQTPYVGIHSPYTYNPYYPQYYSVYQYPPYGYNYSPLYPMPQTPTIPTHQTPIQYPSNFSEIKESTLLALSSSVRNNPSNSDTTDVNQEKKPKELPKSDTKSPSLDQEENQ